MSSIFLTIQPRDSIVVRDGRPFGVGQTKMRPVDWPYPQLVAGSLRTMAGKSVGAYRPAELNEIRVRGPLPLRDGRIYFPVPADLVLDEGGCIYRSRPIEFDAGGTNLPPDAEVPSSLGNTKEFKPVRPPAFLDRSEVVKWLIEDRSTFNLSGGAAMAAPAQDERAHTAVHSESQSALEHQLYSTTGLSFADNHAMAAAVDASAPYSAHFHQLQALHPIGGERRLARWTDTTDASSALWECPKDVRSVLKPGEVRIRMTLATPAIWRGGWLPQWAKSGGVVPSTTVKLKLVGACLPRWRPISGFSLEAGRRGPKPVRWMAPAGSTYFFRTDGQNVDQLADLWLRPVGDSDQIGQDQRDGFGLALWGIWRDHDGK